MASSTLSTIAGNPLGVYVHVPFCRVHCPYCDFYTYPSNRGHAPDFIGAVLREIELASQRLNPAEFVVETVYFGGGTPSTLEAPQLDSVLDALGRQFKFHPQVEITLEANPEDVTPLALETWQALGINRVSLGVQTFDPGRLQFLGRVHSADSARRALGVLAGFPNWSADLMFGWQGQTTTELEKDLGELLSYAPPHASLYQLTLEPRTRMGVLAARNLVACADSDQQADLYLTACTQLDASGLAQYEVSNFARGGFESRHNRSYWERKAYLGLGPSAASFMHERRSRNLASWPRYRDRLQAGYPAIEQVEVLSPHISKLERVWLGLRTAGGIASDTLSAEVMPLVFEAAREGLVSTAAEGRITLTRKGMAMADEVAARLLPTENTEFGI